MISEQLKLSLNSATISTSYKTSSKLSLNQSIYRTTKEAVKILGLERDYLLLKARSNGSSYRSDRYIVVPAGRNKWELFKLCKS